jgi:hypothetical protein
VGCCFVAPLEEKELLRRKWLLLLWGSVEASLKRSCWIVGENLVVLGRSRRCLTVVRKVALCFQTVEGERPEREVTILLFPSVFLLSLRFPTFSLSHLSFKDFPFLFSSFLPSLFWFLFYLHSHSASPRFKLPFPFSFQRALSRPKKILLPSFKTTLSLPKNPPL